jgi:protein-tyrosine phosphatase
MTAPMLDFALDVVQVMHSVLVSGAKVAVHCHAGLGTFFSFFPSYFFCSSPEMKIHKTGRTGLVIACYLVLVNFTPKEAIEHVRKRRSKN